MYYSEEFSDVRYTRVFRLERVVARKEYVCTDCFKTIKVGEDHVYRVGIFDGTFFAERAHTDNGYCTDYE